MHFEPRRLLVIVFQYTPALVGAITIRFISCGEKYREVGKFLCATASVFGEQELYFNLAILRGSNVAYQANDCTTIVAQTLLLFPNGLLDARFD